MKKKIMLFVFVLLLIPIVCSADFDLKVINETSFYMSFILKCTNPSGSTIMIVREVIFPDESFVGKRYEPGVYEFRFRCLKNGKLFYNSRINITDKMANVELIISNDLFKFNPKEEIKRWI
jgi:hypothetical protein